MTIVNCEDEDDDEEDVDDRVEVCPEVKSCVDCKKLHVATGLYNQIFHKLKVSNNSIYENPYLAS